MLDDGEIDHIDASMPHSSCFESFADDEDWHEDEDFDDGDIQQINVDFDDLIWFVNFNIYFWCNIVEVVLFFNVNVML